MNADREVQEWLGGQPIWVQRAFKKLRGSVELNDDEVRSLAEECFRNSARNETLEPVELNVEEVDDLAAIEYCRLAEIAKPVNINGLNPQNPLPFLENGVTVIYGDNGSGKSGYVRMLKRLVGSRASMTEKTLHGDVRGNYQAPQSVTLTYRLKNTAVKQIFQIADGPVRDLSSIQIFDSRCGAVYVNEENQVSYEPQGIRLLGELGALCTKRIRKIFEDSRAENLKPRCEIPKNIADHDLFKLIESSLRDGSFDVEGAESHWSEVLSDEEKALEKQLAEKSPKERAKILRVSAEQVSRLMASIELALSLCGEDTCAKLEAAQKSIDVTQNSMRSASDTLRETSPLGSVGSKEWRQLWEIARTYSNTIVYPEKSFPSVDLGSRCVLCEQELEGGSKERLVSFEEFAQSELSRQLKKNQEIFQELAAKLKNCPSEVSQRERLETVSVSNPNLADGCRQILSNCLKRVGLLEARQYVEARTQLVRGESCVDDLNLVAESMIVEAEELEKVENIDARNRMLSRRDELLCAKWISENSAALGQESRRQKTLRELQSAIQATLTDSITRKANSLTKKYVTEELRKQFKVECEQLGIEQDYVTLEKSEPKYGRVFHRIKLAGRDIPVDEVLSEGEFKIIALAAFFADVSRLPGKPTIVLDDPVCSLDHLFRKEVIRRLVRLGMDHQVIVFTHEIPTLVSLSDAAADNSVEFDCIGLSREPWGAGEVRKSIPIGAKSVGESLDTLTKKAKEYEQILNREGWEVYEPLGKSLCCDFRILLERVVEEDLINKVVMRFRQSVTSDGRLSALTVIEIDDCNLIDRLMGDYSDFLHSKAQNAPVKVKKPQDINRDAQSIVDLKAKLKKRRKEVGLVN